MKPGLDRGPFTKDQPLGVEMQLFGQSVGQIRTDIMCVCVGGAEVKANMKNRNWHEYTKHS